MKINSALQATAQKQYAPERPSRWAEIGEATCPSATLAVFKYMSKNVGKPFAPITAFCRVRRTRLHG